MILEFDSVARTANDILAKVRTGEIATSDRFECWHCHNSGFREIDDPRGGPNKGVVRCDRCEYWRIRREQMAGS